VVVRTTLAEVPVGADVVIQAVHDEDPDRLRYMEARGLLPGVSLTLDDRQPFDGPITVLVGGSLGTPQVLGYELATRIYVVHSTPA
jgi:DtxR family Mn-dependent transcriptional regulator